LTLAAGTRGDPGGVLMGRDDSRGAYRSAVTVRAQSRRSVRREVWGSPDVARQMRLFCRTVSGAPTLVAEPTSHAALRLRPTLPR